MNRFLDKPTPTELKAVDALRQVLREGGSVERVFAIVESPERGKIRESRLGARVYGRSAATAAWLQRKRMTQRELFGKSPLELDHTSLYRRPDGTRTVVTEPYWLRLREMRDLVAYADKYGLDVTVSASQSAWFPGVTLAVETELASAES